MRKSIIKKFSLLLLITLIISYFPVQSTEAKLKEMPKDLSVNQAYEEFSKSNNLQIYLIGNSSIVTNNLIKDKVKKIDKTIDIKGEKKYNSIWISKDMHDKYLNKKGIRTINKYLDKGYSVYFLGLKDPNIINTLFFEGQAKEELLRSDIEQQVAFLTKNEEGELFTGVFLSQFEYTSDSLLKSIAASSWNRKSDKNYTRKKTETNFFKQFNNEAAANYGSDFTIGSGWKNVFSWKQYNVQSAYGVQTEWKAAFYLTNPVDGKDYYAMAIETAMDPAGGVAVELQYKSDADSNGQSNLLRSYNPKASPTSNTYTFSFGGGYSKDGPSANIGASWTVSKDELELHDYSSPSTQKMDITFDYAPCFYCTYAKQTTWQNLAFIYQASNGSDYCKIDNYRKSTFESSGYSLRNSESAYYITTVYK